MFEIDEVISIMIPSSFTRQNEGSRIESSHDSVIWRLFDENEEMTRNEVCEILKRDVQYKQSKSNK